MTDNIQITLHNAQQTPYGIRLFPNSIIEGTIQVIPARDLNCRHLFLRLEWHTEGRGTRDNGRPLEVDLYEGKLNQGILTTYDFRIQVPIAPWSYAGHYINIVWEIVVSLDIAMATDPTARLPFILLPEGR